MVSDVAIVAPLGGEAHTLSVGSTKPEDETLCSEKEVEKPIKEADCAESKPNNEKPASKVF